MWEQLVELGIEPKEARFYLTLLSMDRPTVAEVAEAAGVSRTNAYDIIKRLGHRGLVTVTETASGGHSRVSAADPRRLIEEAEERRRALDAVVPELRALYAKSGVPPRVRYFEGAAGIRTALFETLQWQSPLKGILSMRDLMTVPGAAAMAEYIQGRRDRRLQLFVVRSPEKDERDGWPTDPTYYRESRHAPREYLFTMTTIIGRHEVVMMSSRQENFALKIESAEYADQQRNLFRLLWRASTPYPKV